MAEKTDRPEEGVQNQTNVPQTEEKDTYWQWKEPEPLTMDEATDLNNNILMAMDSVETTKSFGSDRLSGLNDFITKLYINHSIDFDSIEDLARFLQCLRAASTIIQEKKKAKAEDEFLVDGVTPTLEMIIDAIGDSSDLLEQVSEILSGEQS